MDRMSEPTSNSPLDFPDDVLRSEMLCPGDVLLTHGSGLESAAIAALTGGEFSHAALVVNQAMTFESDGHVIGHRAIQWLGWGKIEGTAARVSRVPSNPKRIVVYRHPALQSLPRGTFDAALRAELKHSFGLDYSEMYRLVPLANLPDRLKPIAVAAFKLYERKKLQEQLSGPFCSELVSRIYERMGLALFDQDRPAADISPNHLAKSNLVEVTGIVVPSTSVADYEALEPALKFAEKLYPATGDPLAIYRRSQRGIQRNLEELDEATNKLRKRSREDLASLRRLFTQTAEEAFRLFEEEQERGNDGLTRWTLRLCTECLELAPALAAASENPHDFPGLSAVLSKNDELSASFYRCNVISKSRLLKELAGRTANPVRRLRLHLARREILKQARQFLHSMS